MTILDDARDLHGDLTELRHRLHRRPEIGLHLPHTQQAVLASLEGLGLEISTGTTSSSVTAVLRGTAPSTPSTPPSTPPSKTPSTTPSTTPAAHDDGGDRPVVLLRGDMDALPVQELVDVPYRSELDGVMHACGHDLHTTMLVGAAHVLARRRRELAGDVVFMFQPGEEGYDGAAHMIADGVLDAAGRRAEAAFALHVLSNLATRGAVASRPGPLMAASDGLFVTVRGRGGHGSTPHVARDPIPVACEMVLALQTMMTRRLDTFAPAVLTVGTLHAGTKRNIIPETATFEATVRTFDPAVRATIEAGARQVCTGIAAAHDLDVDVRFEAEYPVTVNDPRRTQFAIQTATELFGAGAALPMPNPLAGSEDFSRVLAQVPGAMLFLGAAVDGRDPRSAPGNHSPHAAFDDRVIPNGAALYASLAARYLRP